VLLAEPPPSQGDLHFRVFGIPVRVHPFFWLIAALLGIRLQEPIQVLIWVAAVFVSILVHEMGHAIAALAHGWQPSVTLYGLGGLASYRPTYHDTRSQVIISLAGPGAGFVFIGLILAVVHLSGHNIYRSEFGPVPFWVAFRPFASAELNYLVQDLIFINIFWGLVNLLPVYPLDGGKVAREVFLNINAREGVVQSLWLSVFTGAGLAAFGLITLRSVFMAVFFGYMAYSSYMMIQQYSGRGGFGGSGQW
jgi:Zn-dependent protease